LNYGDFSKDVAVSMKLLIVLKSIICHFTITVSDVINLLNGVNLIIFFINTNGKLLLGYFSLNHINLFVSKDYCQQTNKNLNF